LSERLTGRLVVLGYFGMCALYAHTPRSVNSFLFPRL
jgi:hypothetical protein